MLTTRDKAKNSLSLVVPVSTTRDHSHSDLVKLMGTYGVLEKAKNAFLSCEITFEEYISLCEKGEVNIDSYLETIEHNLIQFNLL